MELELNDKKEMPEEYFCFKEHFMNIIQHYLSLRDSNKRENLYLHEVLGYVNDYTLNNDSSNEYAFSLSIAHENGGCDYISFDIADNTISVTIGGSVYDDIAGSDSFSNTIYYIQDDGLQEVNDSDSLHNLENIGIGYINNGAIISIENDEE